MGTHALVRVYPENTGSSPVVTIYVHYDGYIFNGLGCQLAKFLSLASLIDNEGIDSETWTEFGIHPYYVCNGMEDLAAQLVVFLKKGTGNVYLSSADSDVIEEYNYFIYPNKINILGYDYCKIFSGSWKEFLDFTRIQETSQIDL